MAQPLLVQLIAGGVYGCAAIVPLPGTLMTPTARWLATAAAAWDDATWAGVSVPVACGSAVLPDALGSAVAETEPDPDGVADAPALPAFFVLDPQATAEIRSGATIRSARARRRGTRSSCLAIRRGGVRGG